jgi:hypothetical protein
MNVLAFLIRSTVRDDNSFRKNTRKALQKETVRVGETQAIAENCAGEDHCITKSSSAQK